METENYWFIDQLAVHTQTQGALCEPRADTLELCEMDVCLLSTNQMYLKGRLSEKPLA